MRTLWVSGLVLALGWLSVTAGDSETVSQPAPAPARASEPAKPALLEGVALGKPVAFAIVKADGQLRSIAVSAARARVEPGSAVASCAKFVARGQSPDDAPPLPPGKTATRETNPDIYVEKGSGSEAEPVLPEAKFDAMMRESAATVAMSSQTGSSQPKKADADVEESSDDALPADRPSSMAPTDEPAGEKEGGGSKFAADRLVTSGVKARAAAPSESGDGDVFAEDHSAFRSGEVKHAEIKTAAPIPSTSPKSEMAHPVVAKGIIARAKDLLHPSTKEREKKAILARTSNKSDAAHASPATDQNVALPSAKDRKKDVEGEPVSARSDDAATVDKDGNKGKDHALAILKDDGRVQADHPADDEKPKDAPIKPPSKFEDKPAEAPTPHFIPQSVDSTTAALGKPTVCCTQENCPYPGQLYGSAEYLVWFTKADHVPPLVTTGPASSNGILGQPGTIVLFGGPGTNLNEDVRQGGRFTLGYWLDPCHECAIEASYFFLGDHTQRFSASSGAFPLLARPFFRENTGSEFSEIVTRPDLSTGRVTIEAPTQLWGAEANVRHPLCCGCSYRLDGLAGFRYLDLTEGLHISEDIITSPTQSVFPNSRVQVSDRFDTHNQFYGGQVGMDGEIYRGRFFLGLRGKVALGDTHETLNINGSQAITDAQGNLHVFRGGLLALQSNIGHFTRDRFAVVPEVGLTVGCQLTDQLRVTVGYNLLYWSNVIRPGEQIDRVIDETLIPNFGARHPPAGQNRPMVLFKETDYWAQGLTFGVEYRY
jgi:hypothetical protein